MSSHRQRQPIFEVECPVALDSAFRCSMSNVESHSTALSDLPGRKSSHTRQRFQLFQIECRPSSLNIEYTRQRFRMSSHRHPFLLFRVECRVTLDSALCSSRSNVESPSTVLSALRGRMSSHIVQRLPIFQVECRVIRQRYPAFHVECRGTFDSAYRPSSLNVESH